MRSLVVTIAVSLLGFSAWANNTGQIPQGIIKMGSGEFYSPYAFVVEKSSKKLFVIENVNGQVKIIHTHESDVGKKPGAKHKLNDHKTPEGVYFFSKWIPGSKLDREKYGIGAFVSNYPNLFDRRAGRNGYGIWLHAIADKVGLDRGSRGCVVVRNDTLEKLREYVSFNQTPFVIFDEINWVTPGDQLDQSSKLTAALSQWRKAWESKDMDTYMSFYAEDFKFKGYNKKRWRRFKERLARKYENIQVNLSTPLLMAHGKNLVAKFYQDYRTDSHGDFGEKTLHLQMDDNGQFRIISESWREATDSRVKALLAQRTDKSRKLASE